MGAVTLPEGVERGVCRVCGDDATSHQSTYCAEHEPERPRRKLRPDKSPRKSATKTRAPKLETELKTNLEMAAMLWQFSDPHCAGVMHEQAGPIAHFWAERARTSTRVARALESIVSSGGWLGGLAVHLPLAMAVYAHHVAPVVAARRESEAGDDITEEQYHERHLAEGVAVLDYCPVCARMGPAGDGQGGTIAGDATPRVDSQHEHR
jgi:hypothetical protein